MTSGPNELKAALKRLIDGNASEVDRGAVRTALNTGVLVTGERAVAIGGNASDVNIVTGDQIVFSFKGADAASVLTALSSIAPTRLHEVPPPPADFTGREDELKELLAAIEIGGVTISGLQGTNPNETRRAIQFVEQYLAIAREIGDRTGEGTALGNLGIAYAVRGEIRPAIQFYEQALLIHRKMGDRHGEGNNLWNMSLALDQVGETQEAIQHAEQALIIFEQIVDPKATTLRAQLAVWREQTNT